MEYMNVSAEGLQKILLPEEIELATTYRIPYGKSVHALFAVQEKVVKALESGAVKAIPHIPATRERAPYVISDAMGNNIHGLQSQADGKMYDSKSSYYKSLKQAGYEVMGNDAPTTSEKRINDDPSVKDDLSRAFRNAKRF